jgi:hypothetical protein
MKKKSFKIRSLCLALSLEWCCAFCAGGCESSDPKVLKHPLKIRRVIVQRHLLSLIWR